MKALLGHPYRRFLLQPAADAAVPALAFPQDKTLTARMNYFAGVSTEQTQQARGASPKEMLVHLVESISTGSDASRKGSASNSSCSRLTGRCTARSLKPSCCSGVCSWASSRSS